MLISSAAVSSPFNIVTEFAEPFPKLCSGYGRINVALPQSSEIIDIDVTRKSIVVHVVIDPSEPMVFRAIDVAVGDQPQTLPVERYLGSVRFKGQAVRFWDLGDFREPVPGCER